MTVGTGHWYSSALNHVECHPTVSENMAFTRVGTVPGWMVFYPTLIGCGRPPCRNVPFNTFTFRPPFGLSGKTFIQLTWFVWAKGNHPVHALDLYVFLRQSLFFWSGVASKFWLKAARIVARLLKEVDGWPQVAGVRNTILPLDWPFLNTSTYFSCSNEPELKLHIAATVWCCVC